MSKKATVIIFVNQKGGCAKSSNVLNISTASLFSGSKDVVVLDCDPQQTLYKWQELDRSDVAKRYAYVLPQIVGLPHSVMPSEVLDRLLSEFDEIWIDTAGFLGFKNETAQQYIENILPYADMIISPLKADKFNVRSTAETIDYLDSILNNINRDIPRLLLASDIKGGIKAYNYTHTLLSETLEKHSNWKYMKTYIPSSIVFAKALESGGNAFVPRQVKIVSDASLDAYGEIQVALGKETAKTMREKIDHVVGSITSIRQQAKSCLQEEENDSHDQDNEQDD